MLLPGISSEPPAAPPAAPAVTSGSAGKVTYVIDEGLISYGKFVGGTLAIFVLVGTYLFGIKLDVTIERMREAQKQLENSEKELGRLKTTAAIVQHEVEVASSAAQSILKDLEGTRRSSLDILADLEIRTRSLSSDETVRLNEARKSEPERFRRGTSEAKLWPNGATLKVRFLDGTSQQKARYRSAFDRWLQHANLKIAYVDDPKADVRVTFSGVNEGAWSYLGTDALGKPSKEPTTNIGYQADGVEEHEIGHVLGLVHEEQNPKSTLKWNKPAVYKAMGGPPNNWDKAAIDNFFTPGTYPGSRPYDRESIMQYSFPSDWFTDGKGTPRNTKLSESDKQYIAALYPK